VTAQSVKMAENKYEMLVRPRRLDSNFKIQQQPWYKERLTGKYEKKPTLLTSSWTFVKDGMDDFRNGIIPKLDSSIVLKGSKGIQPSIFGSSSSVNKIQNQELLKHLSKKEAAYTRTLPSQQRKQKKVNEVEQKLLAHPLALYPHIEDSVPPDLFEEIVDLLDPSMTLANDMSDQGSESSVDGLSNLNSNEQNLKEININAKAQATPSSVDNSYSNAFRRLPNKKTPNNEEDERNSRKKGKQTQLTKIETVTKEFCGWIRDLGGDTNNIEEATIKNLFATGYESKPALSVPVHVVELTSVPAELRLEDKEDRKEENILPAIKKKADYTPSWVKVKYGAWYLDPKTWKAREADKPLRDPREINEKQMTDAKKKTKTLDKTLTMLHGAQAFKEFVESKGTRKPEFLENVVTTIDRDSMEPSTMATSKATNNQNRVKRPENK